MTKVMCQGTSYLGAREMEGPWPLPSTPEAETSLGTHTSLECLASAVPSKGLSQRGHRACGSGHFSPPAPLPSSHEHPCPPSPATIHEAQEARSPSSRLTQTLFRSAPAPLSPSWGRRLAFLTCFGALFNAGCIAKQLPLPFPGS